MKKPGFGTGSRVHEIISPDLFLHYDLGVIKGINEWKEKLYEPLITAFPDAHIEIDDIIANGDFVITRWKAQGIHKGTLYGVPPSGEMVEFNGITWMKIVDGKIVQMWNNWNISYFFQRLLSELNTLRGILPLCSYCKKIRDDKGYWEQVDVYIHKYSAADISHSICPECMKKHYPDINIEKPNQ